MSTIIKIKIKCETVAKHMNLRIPLGQFFKGRQNRSRLQQKKGKGKSSLQESIFYLGPQDFLTRLNLYEFTIRGHQTH